MNRKELERTRRENLNKLDTAFRPKINAVEIDINNSSNHEFAKFMCVWLIRKGCPANTLSEIFEEGWDEEGVLTADFDCEDYEIKHEWERPQVVTEARFGVQVILKDISREQYENKHNQKEILKHIKEATEKMTRRADIFILDTGEIVEIETNKKVKKEGDNVITIHI